MADDPDLYEVIRRRSDAADLHGNGEAVARYEASLAEVFQAPWAISMASGTAALYASLIALGVRAGDQVAVPITAPVMSVLPILAMGAVPALCDVRSPESFGLDVNDLRRLGGLAAVISVPMWGYWDEDSGLVQYLADSGLPLIIDAAQAHHVRLEGESLSTVASVVCYSTHARKPLSTGEGGFCLCSDEAIATSLRSARNFGQEAEVMNGRIVASGPYGTNFGLNLKLSGVLAEIGRGGLGDLAEDYHCRISAAAALSEAIGAQGAPVVEINHAPGSSRGLYGYALHLHRHDARIVGARMAATCPAEVETHRYGYDLVTKAGLLRAFARPTPRAQQLVDSIIAIRLAGFEDGWADQVGDSLVSALAQAPLRRGG